MSGGSIVNNRSAQKMSQRMYFSGVNVDQALVKAARHFGLEPSELSYEVLDKKHGFVRRRRGVVIVVDPDAPRPAAPSEPETVAAGPAEAAVAPPVEPQAPAPRPRAADSEPGVSGLEPTLEPPHDEMEAAPMKSAAAAQAAPPARPMEPAAPQAVGEPATAAKASEEAPTGEAAAPDPEEIEAVREAVELMLRLGALEVDATISWDGDRYEIELQGEDEDVMVDEDGRLLMSVEHLLPRLVRGLIARPVHCRVDAGGFHAAREERLREMAHETANRVRRAGEEESLAPMAPDERRIVHLALADDDSVATQSVGRGLFKRVVIRPARAQG